MSDIGSLFLLLNMQAAITFPGVVYSMLLERYPLKFQRENWTVKSAQSV
jgi:hypothetical protein